LSKEAIVAAYVIAEIETNDEEEMRRYRELVPPTITAYGGRYIVRGGAVQTLEGDWAPRRLAVLEFESAEQAGRWWASEEYRELKAMRQRAGRTRMVLVEGV
jgi:uncharacterized protein (DUF1330 family)